MQFQDYQFVYEETFWDCGEFTIVKEDLPYLSDDFEYEKYFVVIKILL